MGKFLYYVKHKMFCLIINNDFFASFRTNWLLSRQALADCRKIDRQYVNEQDLIKVNIWFAQSKLILSLI